MPDETPSNALGAVHPVRNRVPGRVARQHAEAVDGGALMTTKQNEFGEFINDFDPYETDRKRIYANCSLRHKKVDIGKDECPICHKQFKPNHSLQKYCSDKCRTLGKKARDYKMTSGGPYQKECDNCHGKFSPIRHNTKFCSEKCRNAAEVKRKRQWYLEQKAKRQKAER